MGGAGRGLILAARHWMPPISPRSGGGIHRLIRWGEPTGLVPRGPGAKGGSRPLALPLAGKGRGRRRARPEPRIPSHTERNASAEAHYAEENFFPLLFPALVV